MTQTAIQYLRQTPFRLPRPRSSFKRTLFYTLKPGMERFLKLHEMNQRYRETMRLDRSRHFAERALEVMNTELVFDEASLENIPKEGPLIVVANHPFGGVEGLALAALLNKVRPDSKILANYMLKMIPDLRDEFFFVDPFDRPESRLNNLAAMRGAMRWVQEGNVLGVFPAGEVSHLKLRQRAVVDPLWNDAIARIVKKTGATVLPVFFDGRNGNMFQVAGMIHPRLRTVMLTRELCKRQNNEIRLCIGSPIKLKRLKRYEDTRDLMDYLRVRTYLLKQQMENHESQRESGVSKIDESQMEKIIDPVDPQVLSQEIEGLPADRVLVQNKDMIVLLAPSHEIPHTLRELGRLRELTFRRLSEGTGKALDLDHFDEYYHHLFIWKPETKQIVGAYRMGFVDQILKDHGKNGLYTNTLFNFKTELTEQIKYSLEMGRSFVAPEFQNNYAPLMLLWKGIGATLCRNPEYKYLVGPVSISAEYSTTSRYLLMAFLEMNKYLPSLGKLLRPKNPPRLSRPKDVDARQFSTVVRDLDEVGDLIQDLESDRKGIPVLLRQYLKLNAKLLGFNVDPEFGDVLDGLVLVEVPEVDPPVLSRYMGKQACIEYLESYGKDTSMLRK